MAFLCLYEIANFIIHGPANDCGTVTCCLFAHLVFHFHPPSIILWMDYKMNFIWYNQPMYWKIILVNLLLI